MPTAKRTGKAGKTKLAYKALEASRNRQLAPARVQTSDAEFDYYKRPLAWNNALDLEQNLALIGWMVRTDLAFTSSFAFQAKCKTDEQNAALEAYTLERFKPRNWDVQRRFGFEDMLRTWSAMKIWFGDSAAIKVQGGRLQLLEAWNIGKGKVPDGMPSSARVALESKLKTVNDNGLVLDPFGAIQEFAVCTGQDSTSRVHNQFVPWDYMLYDGFFPRPTATRGVSPLLPVMNHARDYMDAATFYWFKIKIASMFGIAIFSDDNTSGNLGFQYNNTGTTPPAATATTKTPLQFDMKPGLKLHLNKDSRAEFLESKSPPAEFIQYAKHTMRLILASRNIPYSLWDSEGATYSAQRADFNLYKMSALSEREKNRAIGDEMLAWAFEQDNAAGKLPVPYEDVDWELVPRGVFILDQSKEVDAIQKKVAIGACTYDDAARELGSLRPFRENVRIQGEEIALANTAGVPLLRGPNPGASQTSGGADPEPAA